MLNILETVLSIGAAFGIASTALFFIAKLFITKSFEAGLERYKVTLQQDLEAHKMNLQLNNYKFTKLHEAQCNAINDIFIKLNKYRKALGAAEVFVSSGNPWTVEQVTSYFVPLRGLIEELEDSYEEKKILLSEQVSQQVFTTIQALTLATGHLLEAFISRSKEVHKDGKYVGLVGQDIQLLDSEDKTKFENALKSVEEVKVEIRYSLSVLETEFRKIYGSQLTH